MAKVVVVYGPKGAGKTTATLDLAARLQKRGLKVGGFYQKTVYDELDRRGYDLIRLASSDSLPLARPGNAAVGGDPTICSFAFSTEAFCSGKAWLQTDATWADVLVIDEVSKLEVGNSGHHDSIRFALASDKQVLLSVRADQLFYVVEKFNLEESIAGYLEIPASDEQREELVQSLVSLSGKDTDSKGKLASP